MTAKRFKLIEYLPNVIQIRDNNQKLDSHEIVVLLNELAEENEQLKFENKNLKAILNDFINILNRLQSNPTDKQILGVARDMLQNMGKELKE